MRVSHKKRSKCYARIKHLKLQTVLYFYEDFQLLKVSVVEYYNGDLCTLNFKIYPGITRGDLYIR